ncbi:type VI secretion system accessory protein TagJ [Serratia sp. L9]|uniref:type VI secretion system accessory protein TagJ n=1 Tax=Serratia sp. L9 TaxID=3423946 RepID=UPI003D664307
MKSLLSVLKDHPLSTALAQAESEVKAFPADADKRAGWVQLLLLYGDWQRATAQLQAWQALSPQAKPTTQQLADTVTAEILREQVFRGEIPPTFLTPPSAWLSALASALQASPERADELRCQAFQQAAESAGTLSLSDVEEPAASADFNWLADGDSRLGPVCELILDDRYYWVPFQDIESISFQAPQNVVHLIWAHAMVKWRSGKQQVCQIPARYPLTASASDSQRLGRQTDWLELNDNGHYAGQGQKSWLTDNDEVALLTLRQIQLTADNA